MYSAASTREVLDWRLAENSGRSLWDPTLTPAAAEEFRGPVATSEQEVAFEIGHYLPNESRNNTHRDPAYAKEFGGAANRNRLCARRVGTISGLDRTRARGFSGKRPVAIGDVLGTAPYGDKKNAGRLFALWFS
jgi:hypothetical protein